MSSPAPKCISLPIFLLPCFFLAWVDGDRYELCQQTLANQSSPSVFRRQKIKTRKNPTAPSQLPTSARINQLAQKKHRHTLRGVLTRVSQQPFLCIRVGPQAPRLWGLSSLQPEDNWAHYSHQAAELKGGPYKNINGLSVQANGAGLQYQGTKGTNDQPLWALLA